MTDIILYYLIWFVITTWYSIQKDDSGPEALLRYEITFIIAAILYKVFK